MNIKPITKMGFRKSISAVILLCFLSGQVFLPSISYAQSILNLPAPGAMVSPSAGYVPLAIKGLKVYRDNPFRFDFILDTGNSKLEGQQLKDETSLLIKYFLAALTVPDDDQWVNLSPYEKDRIIPKEFGVTEMGRDLLASDYLLKQLTASLIYPEHELGKKFWEKVRKTAHEKFGDVEVLVNTFNKVWIMPDHAKVYENGQVAFITESHLKVMLESDYLAQSVIAKSPQSDAAISKSEIASHPSDVRNDVNTEIVREVVIPEIEKEVNEGKNFAKLRQIYHSMIMAAWFKRKLKDGILSKIYVGANKVAGVEYTSSVIARSSEKATKQSFNDKELIYQQYLAAFKKGVYNYIAEELDETTQEIIPRKYFAGGFAGKAVASSTAFEVVSSPGQLSGVVASNTLGELRTAEVSIVPARFGSNNDSDIPQSVLDAIRKHSAADPLAEREYRLEMLRLMGFTPRSGARVTAADWARAALRNILVINRGDKVTVKYTDEDTGRDIFLTHYLGDKSKGRFDPARGIIALREDADQFVLFHEASEMVMRIFYFRKYLTQNNVDMDNPQALITYAQGQGFNVQDSEDALGRLMDDFFLTNPEVANRAHERASRWEKMLRIKAHGIKRLREALEDDGVRSIGIHKDGIPKESSGGNDLLNNVKGLVEQKGPDDGTNEILSMDFAGSANMIQNRIFKDFSLFQKLKNFLDAFLWQIRQDIPGRVALEPEHIDEPAVLAGGRIFLDTEGQTRFMDKRVLSLDPSLRTLIIELGIEVRTISDDEWVGMFAAQVAALGAKIQRGDTIGDFDSIVGFAAAMGGANQILLPQTMSLVDWDDMNRIISHEIGHAIDYQTGLREVLSHEADEVIADVMRMAEGYIKAGGESLRDDSGAFDVLGFKERLKNNDVVGFEVVAEAFSKAWFSREDSPGVKFFRDIIPQGFEGLRAQRVSAIGQTDNVPARLGADNGNVSSSTAVTAKPDNFGLGTDGLGTPSDVASSVGGIDMNQKALDLQTEGDEIKFDMPFDPTQLQNIQIDGFSPVILQIVPTNLPLFIGSKEIEDQKATVYAAG